MQSLNLGELLTHTYWNQYLSKDELLIYDYVAGHVKYAGRPYHTQDLNPDIIMKVKLPQEKYASQKQPDLSELISIEADQVSRAYSRAEKGIISDMSSKVDRQNKLHEYTRMFTSLQQTFPCIKECQINQDEQNKFVQQQIEIQCKFIKNQQIDLFTIRINTIVYILQRYCGFKVRSFILEEQESKIKSLFMFLYLSQENIIKSAQQYGIKKEIYPSYVDFYLNDPSNIDGRPLRFSSSFQQLQARQIKQNKIISRFYKEPYFLSNSSSIIQETDVSNDVLQNFISYNQSVFELHQDVKKSQYCQKLTNYQKILIYNYTKKRNMKACLCVFKHHKQRQAYNHLLLTINNHHGFKVHQSLRTFKEFFIPNKLQKGSSFKSKIQALVMFVPQVVNHQGQLDFFSRMEKTKMCYLKLKNAFKLDFLFKLHYECFTLSNDFEKFGSVRQKCNYEFANVVISWPFHSFFTDIYPIRNYFGNNVGFQIYTVVSIIQYLASVSTIYFFIFMVEQFNGFILIVTRYINSALFVVGVQIFSAFWKEKEQQFINRYSDQKDQHLFLREHKGPYVRNPLNDELNEFHNSDNQTNFIGNIICTGIVSVILVLIGLFFFAIRQLLIYLSGSMGSIQFSIFSLDHFIAYFLYFVVLTIFQQIFSQKIASALGKFLNPSTYYHKRKLEKNIVFNCLLGTQFIAPLFFLVIEPLNKTSCFADSCRTELQFYVSSRYIFITIFKLYQLAKLILSKMIKKPQLDDNGPSFQIRLARLLQKASLEASKKQFEFDHAQIIVYMITFAMYCTLVTNSCLFSLLGMFVFHLNMRMKLLYHKRRPIDKSQEILPFSPQLDIMYYFGIIFNSWIIIFSYEFVENYCQLFLETFAINTQSGLFMTKMVVTGLYSILLFVFGKCLKVLIKACRGNSLIKRRNKKLKEYKSRKGEAKIHKKKIEDYVPLRTIFRVFNDDSIVKRLALEYLLGKQLNNDQMISQTNLIRVEI